ncbi:hypothetical protein EBT25_01450 [bacterium]|jgi:hypothetical protein|nr:hypothetical protein [bacterium]
MFSLFRRKPKSNSPVRRPKSNNSPVRRALNNRPKSTTVRRALNKRYYNVMARITVINNNGKKVTSYVHPENLGKYKYNWKENAYRRLY